MDDGFLGEIRAFSADWLPPKWTFCDGTPLSIKDNNLLFGLIGTTYGGDGHTNFCVPDLRSRVVLGSGQGPGLQNYRLGDKGGLEEVQITKYEMPPHQHKLELRYSNALSTPNAENAYPGNYAPYAQADPAYGVQSPVEMQPMEIEYTGGNAKHENRQPYVAMNWMICVEGVYPNPPGEEDKSLKEE